MASLPVTVLVSLCSRNHSQVATRHHSLSLYRCTLCSRCHSKVATPHLRQHRVRHTVPLSAGDSDRSLPAWWWWGDERAGGHPVDWWHQWNCVQSPQCAREQVPLVFSASYLCNLYCEAHDHQTRLFSLPLFLFVAVSFSQPVSPSFSFSLSVFLFVSLSLCLSLCLCLPVCPHILSLSVSCSRCFCLFASLSYCQVSVLMFDEVRLQMSWGERPCATDRMLRPELTILMWCDDVQWCGLCCLLFQRDSGGQTTGRGVRIQNFAQLPSVRCLCSGSLRHAEVSVGIEDWCFI